MQLNVEIKCGNNSPKIKASFELKFNYFVNKNIGKCVRIQNQVEW